MAEARPAQGSFAARLATARDTIRRPDGKKYSYEDIAAGVRDYTGDSCSKQHIALLLSGESVPTQPKIEGIAHVFGLPPGYFFNNAESERMQEDLKLGAAIREAGVRGLAARMLDVDPGKRETLLRMLEEITRRETLAQSSESGPESP